MPTRETVLHQVITKTENAAERTRIFRALIGHGADVNRATAPGLPTKCFMRDVRTRGETPLHRAAAYSDAEMVSALICARPKSWRSCSTGIFPAGRVSKSGGRMTMPGRGLREFLPLSGENARTAFFPESNRVTKYPVNMQLRIDRAHD